jgi:hypothetical protein
MEGDSMIERIADRAEAALDAANDTSREAQFSHAVRESCVAHAAPSPEPKAPPAHHHGLAGLWDDAVGAASDAYQASAGAIHTMGHTVDGVAGQAIDAGSNAVRSVAGTGVADAVHGVAESLRGDVKQTIGFDVGLTEGAADAVGGMVKGVGDLAGEGYRFATNGSFRGQVIHGAESLATQLTQHPLNTVTTLGSAAINAGKNWVRGAAEAARQGDLGEYLGKGVGSAAVNVGGFFIPGADVADGVNVAGNLGKASEVLGDTSELAGGADALGDAAKLERGAGALGVAKGADDARPVQISLREVAHTLPDWHMQDISYTKRTDAARDALRAAFAPVRRAFVKNLAEHHAAALRDAGLSSNDIALMAKGRVPDGYEVHHLLPLDDGGSNATDNLVLIRDDPDHKLITRYQIEQTKGMEPGDTRRLEWPMPDHQVRVWPETPDRGAHPTGH